MHMTLKGTLNIMEHAAQCLQADKELVLFPLVIKKGAVFWYSA